MGIHRIQRSWSTGWCCALGLALTLCGNSGCRVVNRLACVLSHAHENRCTCQCPAPVVASMAVAPPQGYLSQGPTVAGEIIAGPAGKSALDVVVDLQNEMVTLKSEQDQLRRQLQQAQETIRQQEQTLGVAVEELQQSTSDLSGMRERLTTWQDELADISAQYLDVQAQRDTAVDEIEQRLQRILAECEADRRTLNVSQPAPQSAVPESSVPNLNPSG